MLCIITFIVVLRTIFIGWFIIVLRKKNYMIWTLLRLILPSRVIALIQIIFNLLKTFINNIIHIKNLNAMQKEKTAQNAAIDAVKSNSRFFEIEITLRLFGVVVGSWFFPPKK